MFSSSETVIDLGVRYSRIIFLFTIAIMANLYFEKVFQAVGRMKVTMTGMMVGCIVNIILDPLIITSICDLFCWWAYVQARTLLHCHKKSHAIICFR